MSCLLCGDPWLKYLPMLHRGLADGTFGQEFPSPVTVTRLEESCALWETLHYLLRSLLGWRDPSIGLLKWYQQGQPVHDSALLKIVADVWNRECELDYYTAWSWTHNLTKACKGPNDWSPSELAEGSIFHNENWWREFLRRGIPRWPNPFYGGDNPLHLGHSDYFDKPGNAKQAAELFQDINRRRAVLIPSHFLNWRDELTAIEDQLPDLNGHSWHVDVFDCQIGYLGRFRQSRITRRWFQGKHSIHMMGNASPAIH